MSKEGLNFNIDWQPAEGVRAPELRATWARLELGIGAQIVTYVEELPSRSLRRSIYVPLYPLAEWFAYNWWYLRANLRPSFLFHDQWNSRSRTRSSTGRAPWLAHHNLRAAGDGFPWPDLTVLPTPTTTILAWHADGTGRPDSRIRFISDGTVEVTASSFVESVGHFIRTVITRLEEEGVGMTPLQQEWDALTALDEEEAEFCEAAARLGLDPFGIPDSVSDVILRAGQQLPGELLQDFLDAADPRAIDDDLTWIAQASELVNDSQAATDPLPEIDVIDKRVRYPWERGLLGARTLRARLSIPPLLPVDTHRWIGIEPVRRVDRSLEGLAGHSARYANVLAIAGHRSEEAKRFAAARALWRLLWSRGQGRFLLTSARAPTQQSERAFAAELLAPSAGLAELIPPVDAPVQPDEVAAASTHYGVNDWVVAYQLINQLEREVNDPSLEDHG